MLSSFKNSKEFKEHCFTLSANGFGKVKVSQLQHMYAVSNGFPVAKMYCEFLDSVANEKLVLNYGAGTLEVVALCGKSYSTYSLASKQSELTDLMIAHEGWEGHWFYQKLSKLASDILLNMSVDDVYSILTDEEGIDHDSICSFSKEIIDIAKDERINALKGFFSVYYTNIFLNVDKEDWDSENINRQERDAKILLVQDFLLYLIELIFKKLFSDTNSINDTLLSAYSGKIESVIEDIKYQFILSHIDYEVASNADAID